MAGNRISNDFSDLACLINQAVLNPHINKEALNQHCDAARHFGFGGLCTSLSSLKAARDRLGPSNKTKLIAVIAFPFGAIPRSIKQLEAEWAIENGAEELDVVPSFWDLNNDKVGLFADELADLCSLELPVRVILDINNLPKQVLQNAIEASIDAGVSGIQTGNGFGRAVTPQDIQMLSKIIRNRCSIKAAGGLHSLPQAIELIEAGAKSLGTSKGAEIMKAFRAKKQ